MFCGAARIAGAQAENQQQRSIAHRTHMRLARISENGIDGVAWRKLAENTKNSGVAAWRGISLALPSPEMKASASWRQRNHGNRISRAW